jgi:hypothetical protein
MHIRKKERLCVEEGLMGLKWRSRCVCSFHPTTHEGGGRKQIPDRSVGVGTTHFRPEIICQAGAFSPLKFDLHARLDRFTSRLRSAREIARYCTKHNWLLN